MKEKEGESETGGTSASIFNLHGCELACAFQLRCRLIYTNYGAGTLNLSILLPFQLVRLTLIPGLHYLPDTEVRYLPHTRLESQVSLGSRLAAHTLDYTKQFHPDSFMKV